MEGRLVALADVYDALLAERPYKQAWSPDAAFAWIGTQAGKHFDPRLASLFRELRPEIETVYATYTDDLDAPWGHPTD